MNRNRPNPDPQTDEELLARLRNGERELFGCLVRRYERELYGYLKRYLGDAELAADVFQNTCVAIFTKIRQYEPGRSARPWMYTIATNQAIDALRRRARRKDGRTLQLGGEDDGESGNGPFHWLEVAGPGPGEQVEGAELRGIVREAVEGLPDLLRHVVILTYFQGLKYQDAADILGVPLGTVKSRLHAALGKLAENWTGPKPDGVESGEFEAVAAGGKPR